jgi:photosystem II stability/assembly factor-like uncharacterized protein
MKQKIISSFAIVALTSLALLSTLLFADATRASVHPTDLPGFGNLEGLNDAPIVTDIQPNTAPNDLNTLVVISGTDFTPGMSGTQVITPPLVYLDSTELADAIWVDTTTLSATVPWGLESGVYTLTVENPDGVTGTLPKAFTVTQGIGVWNAGELYGGAIDKIAINPITPTTLYASYHKVGLFRSYDGGENWTFQFSGLGVDNPVVDPNDPETIFVAQWTTVYRSDDEGDTWNQLTTTYPSTSTFENECWGGFGILPHPTVSGTVYVHACDNGDGKSGLIKSTNWGQDWAPAINGLTDTQVTALAFHPDDPNIMYLGTAGGHIFHSVDGGDSWIYDSQPLEYVAVLVVDPFGDHNIWISSRDTFGAPCALLKSAGADLTIWTAMEPQTGYPTCFLDIDFSPITSGTVYVNLGPPYKTIDGGNTWTPFAWVPFDDNSPSLNDIALHPTISDTIYFAEQKLGVQKTINGGTTWKVVNQGLTALVPEQLQVPHDNPDTIYAQMEWAGVYKGTHGGRAWQQLPISHTSFILIDPLTSTKVYATVDNGCTPYVYTSPDGGQSWESSAPMTRPVQYSDHCSFGMAMVAVPDQPGVLLVGVHHHHAVIAEKHGSIYRSTDDGGHWTRIYPTGENEIQPVIILAHDELTPTIIYAGTEGDGMLRSSDAGQTWQPMAEDIPALDIVRTIAVEPVPPYRVYALSWTEVREIYVSEDHGDSWSPVIPPPDAPNTYQILNTETTPSVLYAASGQGLSYSTDGAQTWQQVGGALGQIPVYSIAAVTTDDRVILYAGTTGGVVETSAIQHWDQSAAGSTLVNAGVYRYTTLNMRLFLPLIAR